MDKSLLEAVQDFGEPWRKGKLNGRLVVLNRNRKKVSGYSLKRAGLVRRELACVNALAGRDPSKLAELVEAVDAIFLPGTEWPVLLKRLRELEDALAAFKGDRK